MLNHCGWTFRGSHKAPRQSSRDLNAWWLPHNAFNMAESSTFKELAESSIVEAPKHACGATVVLMKNVFVQLYGEFLYPFGSENCRINPLFCNVIARMSS